ncbi:MAG: copper-translocating P-type ATPase [Candidatus Nitrosotenuis sp.]
MQKQKCVGCSCSEELEVQDLGKTKFLIILGLALTIPIVILETLFDSVTIDIVLLALATPIQVLLGKPFYERFYRMLIHRHRLTTDTLVVLSTTVAYVYGIVSLITAAHAPFFEASASVLTIFTIGEYIENKVKKTTTGTIKRLLELKPKTATVLREGKEETIKADAIQVGDTVIVRPGERIATDGEVIYGESSVDESMITGESIPVDKKSGSKIIGGTINKNGYLRFKATQVGSHTALASIIDLVEQARTSKAPVQRIADRAVEYFVPVVFLIAISSSLFWAVSMQSIPFALTVFATVLVVACPCALGIATPLVMSLGIDKAARQGILVKNGEYLERLASVDTIVFDKTGTLTKGMLEVTDVVPSKGHQEETVLQLAASAEVKSEHPISKAIVAKASDLGIRPLEMTKFEALTGYGISAICQQRQVFVGSPKSKEKLVSQDLESEISKMESEGKTVVLVVVDDQVTGIIALADTARENTRHIIEDLSKMGKDVMLISGDNLRTARAIAQQIGITNVLAPVLPGEKAAQVKKLQGQGKKVAMVGDGINDAPALTQADVGIAIGSGTDVAISAGHIIIMKSDLHDVIYAIKLAKHSMSKIKQNLAISFSYNAVTIPIAAGILYGVTNSLILAPGLAALGWIISDSSVFGNSLLVRRFGVKHENQT